MQPLSWIPQQQQIALSFCSTQEVSFLPDLVSPGPSPGYLYPCHSKANLRMQALPWATLEGCLEASSSTAEHSCPSWEQGKLAAVHHTCAPCSELAASSLLGPGQGWLNIDKAGNELSSGQIQRLLFCLASLLTTPEMPSEPRSVATWLVPCLDLCYQPTALWGLNPKPGNSKGVLP